MVDSSAADTSRTLEVAIHRLPGNEDIPLPEYATEHAAGMDLRAAIPAPIEVPAGGRVLIPTGIRVALPPGFEAQVRPRSGLALRHGIVLPNSPGTIDADYRGEIAVIIMNLGDAPFVIRRGDRIAQLVVAPCCRVTWHPAPNLDDTPRGDGGFGHTGR